MRRSGKAFHVEDRYTFDNRRGPAQRATTVALEQREARGPPSTELSPRAARQRDTCREVIALLEPPVTMVGPPALQR
jgi:hypothetical protein